MANKEYLNLTLQPSGTFTKIRAEQIRSEDSLVNLAVDLEALRGQVKDIIGAADYKEEITGEYAKVQIVDLADHLDAAMGNAALSVKKNIAVVGSGTIAGTLDVNGQSTFASANVEDLTSGRIVVAGTNGELEDFSGLTFSGGELSATSATVVDLAAGKVVLAGTGGALQTDGEISWSAGTLSVSGSTFSKNVSITGDLAVAGDFQVNGTLTYVNTTDLKVTDKKIVIAEGASGASLDGAGIYLGSDASVDESIRWTTADGGKWIASDKFMADTLQAGDIDDAPVAVDGDGNLVEMDFSSWVAGTASQLIVSRSGTDFHGVTLSLPQDIHTGASPAFVGMTLSGLDSAPLAVSNAGIIEEMDFSSWVLGTSNQLIVSRSGTDFHGVSLSLPQDIHSGASPEFLALNLGSYGDLIAAGSDFKIAATGVGGALSFDDSFRGGSTYSAPLKLASASNQYDLIETLYGGEKSILEMLIAAAPGTVARKVHTFTVSGGATSTLTKAASGGWTAAVAMGGGKSDVYVNGQLQLEGAGKDFDFGVAGANSFVLNFTYQLQNDDVVRVVRYAAAVS